MASAHLFLISPGEEELLRVRSSAALGSWVLFGLCGYLPHSDFRVRRIWVTFVLFFFFFFFYLVLPYLYYCFIVLLCYLPYLLFCIFLYLYCIVSILWSSVACRLDTYAGFLSVAYAPFGTVPAVYCLYGMFLTVLKMMNTVGSYRSSHPPLNPLGDRHSYLWPVFIFLGLPTSGWIDIVCWLPVILHPEQLSD